jgi:hypothetical protein
MGKKNIHGGIEFKIIHDFADFAVSKFRFTIALAIKGRTRDFKHFTHIRDAFSILFHLVFK